MPLDGAPAMVPLDSVFVEEFPTTLETERTGLGPGLETQYRAVRRPYEP